MYLCKVHTNISHSGVVESVTGGCVNVRILQAPACGACKVAGHCNAAESKEKIVEVFCDNSESYKKGQEVTVTASGSVARKALYLGFVWPFLILVVVIFAGEMILHNEGLAAVCALAALVPYYLVLYLCRNKISRQITFSIE